MLSERALERRLKRYLRKDSQEWFVVGAPGFEPELESEVRVLPDVNDVEVVTGGVNFRGPLDTVYYANLHLRTAHRVLLRVRTFLAQTYPMMYDHARKVPWELYVGFAPSFAIRVHASLSRLRHKGKIAQTLADGAVQRLAALGLPGRYDESAPIEFHVRLFEDRCTLSLNTSGEHLHKRGYRTNISKAPIRETLAAAVLVSVKADSYNVFIDPFCGSGTLLLEAIMIRASIAPGLFRPFAFFKSPFFQNNKWLRLKNEAENQRRKLDGILCIANDIDTRMLKAVIENAEVLGVQDAFTTSNIDARDIVYSRLSASSAHTLVVSNLPYGKRIASRDWRALIDGFLDKLRSDLMGSGVRIGLIASSDSNISRNQIHLERSKTFRNGGIPVHLFFGRI